VSLQTKAVYAASERHYTAAGEDVQVPRAGIYVWLKAEPQEIDARIGKDNAVLRVLYRSVVTKRELSSTVKLSVFKSIYVLFLTRGHESWVMTERILPQMQAPKLGFLRRVQGVTKGRTEVELRPVQETSLAPPYLNLSYFGIKCPTLRKKLATLLRLFGGAQWFGVQGIVPSRYAVGVTLRDKLRSCEIHSALNIEPLLLTERIHLR